MIDPYDDDEEQKQEEDDKTLFVILSLWYIMGLIVGVILCAMADEVLLVIGLIVFNIPIMNSVWERLMR